MRKRRTLWITSMSLVVFLFVAIINLNNTNIIKAASDLGFEWKKNDTMDELLQVVSNKAGDDEVLINWNLEDYGEYKLEYYLTDKYYCYYYYYYCCHYHYCYYHCCHCFYYYCYYSYFYLHFYQLVFLYTYS